MQLCMHVMPSRFCGNLFYGKTLELRDGVVPGELKSDFAQCNKSKTCYGMFATITNAWLGHTFSWIGSG